MTAKCASLKGLVVIRQTERRLLVAPCQGIEPARSLRVLPLAPAGTPRWAADFLAVLPLRRTTAFMLPFVLPGTLVLPACSPQVG
jgi:hypothetical protein